MPQNFSLKYLFEKCLLFRTDKEKLETRPKEIVYLPHCFPLYFSLKTEMNTANYFTVSESRHIDIKITMVIWESVDKAIYFGQHVLLSLAAWIVRALWNSPLQKTKFDIQIHVSVQRGQLARSIF